MKYVQYFISTWSITFENYELFRVSLIVQLVKNPPAMQEILVQSLGWEDPLEKGWATHSSILAWRIPWTVKVKGLAKSQTQLRAFHTPLY